MPLPADDAPLDELCQFIVLRHHAYLYRALPVIEAQLSQVAGVEVHEAFADLVSQLHSHLAKEENLLFPAIEALARADRQGSGRPQLPFSTVLYPIRLMETEHARIEEAIARLRDLTRESDVIELVRLEEDVHEHHRAENQVLFPRALELEQRLS